MLINKIYKKNFENKNNGFSLIELVVAMGILMIFMPTVIGLMHSSIIARDSAKTNNMNNMNTSTINLMLKKDIESSVAVSTTNNGKTLRMATKEGATAGDGDGVTCREWRVDGNGNLVRGNSISKLPTATGTQDTYKTTWTTVYDKVFERDSETPVFEYNDKTMKYEMKLGDKDNGVVIRGLAKSEQAVEAPRNATYGTKGICW